MRYVIFLPFFLLFLPEGLNADALYLKDGQEAKGVVVEDYHDRIMLSTENGEICYLKKDIEKIRYDSAEDNLVKLGALYKDKREYKTALYYYEAAYRLNPALKEAQDGMLLMSNTIFRKKEDDLKMQVGLRQDTEEKKGEAGPQEGAAPYAQTKAKELAQKVGISIKAVNYEVRVDGVLKGSPAYNAGVKEGDTLISVWGKLLRYMQIEQIYKVFLNSTVSELKVVVARDAPLSLKRSHIFNSAEDMLGGRLKIEYEGLVVGDVVEGGPLEKAGFLKGDLITKVNNFSTRYLPLESIYKIIEGTKGDSLNFEIQRELIIWKQG